MSKLRAYVGATVINGDKNVPVIENGLILVDEEGMIIAIGAVGEVDVPEGVEIIDLAGKYVMPGLINGHTHLFLDGRPQKDMTAAGSKLIMGLLDTFIGRWLIYGLYKRNTKTFVNSGVTTLRDVGSFFNMDLKVRDAIKAGKLDGPRIIASGAIICPTGGHGSQFPGTLVADGVPEVLRAVRTNYHHGVDWIKICSTGGVTDAKFVGEAGLPHMSVEEIRAVCEDAHRRHLLVASHCESTAGMRDCLEAGVDTIEHGGHIEDDMVELFLDNPHTLRGYTSLIPTLAAARGIWDNRDYLKTSKAHEIILENCRLVMEGCVAGFQKALETGIKIGVGTDSSVPFVTPYNTYHELLLFEQASDLTPLEIIHIATKETAEIINVDYLTGTLDAGKAADFIVLAKNPLEDLHNLKQPHMVVAAGKLYDTPKYKEIEGVGEYSHLTE